MNKKMIGIGVGTAVLVGVVSFFGYRYYQMSVELSKFQSDPKKMEETAKKEMEKLVSAVGKLMTLPTSTPTVATVSDVEKLRNQPFFASAANGDKVLIYPDIKKAILYRPSIGKIIDVSALSQNTEAAVASQVPVKTPPSFVILNGTQTVGLTKIYELSLKKLLNDAVVVDTDNAKKNDYTKSVLVDMTGGKKLVEAQAIAKTLSLPFGELPKGEASPSAAADFLIILGTDKK